MNFFINNLGVVFKQMTEVGKRTVKENKKVKEDDVQKKQDFVKKVESQTIVGVESKDDHLKLLHRKDEKKGKSDKMESDKNKLNSSGKPISKEIHLKEDYKGNFLDIEE